MKKRKLMLVAMSVILVILIAVGCSNNNSEVKPDEEVKPVEPVTLKVASPGGPTALTLVKLIQDNPSMGEKVTTEYEVLKTPDILTSKLIGGELDFAVVPTNLAAVLNNKGVDYKLIASSVWGVLYIATSEDIGSYEDLKGKEIYTIGRGVSPDILLRYILTNNGIDPDKDVKINYLTSPQELAQFMISGKATVAVMPEPLLTATMIKNENVKIVFDMQNEWSNITNLESYPQSSLIVKGSLLEERPEVVNNFLEEYKKSIEWANNNPKDAGVIAEGLNVGLKAPLVMKAIPRSNLKFVSIKDAKPTVIEYLKVLFEFSPKSVGGKMPGEELYMEQ